MGVFDDLGPTVTDLTESASNAVSGAVDSIGGAITAGENALADGLSGVTDAVGGAIGEVESAIGGIASGVTGALGAIGGAVGGLLSGAGSLLKGLGSVENFAVPLPIPNPLHNYASYNILISISCLSKYSYANPDTTYMKGQYGTFLFRDASATPDNRVSTPWGKFEFYADNLVIRSNMAATNGSNSNIVNDIDLDIIEPYSLGMLWNAMQIAASNEGWGNWKDAPFLLHLEFKGNTETGSMLNIPGCNRYIPVKFREMNMTASEKGSVYKCIAFPYNDLAVRNSYKNLKSDHTVTGTTVVQMLQSGEKSLQNVINQKLKQVADANKVTHPDQVLILFPVENQSSADTKSNSTAPSAGPTVDANAVGFDSFLHQLGLESSKNNPSNYIQSKGVINQIGNAKMKFDDSAKGDTPMAKDRIIYDESGTNVSRGAATTNTKESDMKFSQDSDIQNAINQVILMSDFADKTLDPGQITPEGYKKWWTIHQQIVPLDHNDKTGETAKLSIYRVLPYDVHIANIPTPGYKPVGTDVTKKGGLKDQVVKEYNYIYTGKNIDVIKFDLKFSFNFYKSGLQDGISGSADAKAAAQLSPANKEQLQAQPHAEGAPTTGESGTVPSQHRYDKTETSTDKAGSGGVETQNTRVARLFHDYITTGSDMVNIMPLEIIGDPYYIVQSGTGNYVSKSTQYKNLNADGSVNHLSGEVHILLNFRNPVDINQGTGFYDFGQNASTPIKQFSGLYKVINVTSKISRNKFTQELELNRLPNQEASLQGTKQNMFGIRSAKNPNDPANQNNSNSNATSSAPALGAAEANLKSVVNEIQSGINGATGLINAAGNVVNQGAALANAAGNVVSQGSALANAAKGIVGKLGL